MNELSKSSRGFRMSIASPKSITGYRKQLAIVGLCMGWAMVADIHADPGATGAFQTETPDTLQHDRVCRHHLTEAHALTRSPERALENEIAAYQSLVEQALVYRERTILEGRRLKEKTERGIPLSGGDLDSLNRGMLAHLELRKTLYAVAETHECWTTLPQETLVQHGVTPQMQLHGVMLSLSAALVLYDNYLLAISIFEENDKLRRKLNAADKGYQIGRGMLEGITAAYHSPTDRARVRVGIRFYEREIRGATAALKLESDASLIYLHALIQQSPSYNATKQHSPLYVMRRQVRFLESIGRDDLTLLSKQGLNLFSKFFGNSVGLVETRRGKLYGRPELVASLRQELRAGDILLEKTPFRLTDMLIPGYWGHAAIWIGNEAELRALGIWQHPLVVQYQADISQGRMIVEALRPGVGINPLEAFLNIDAMAILRARDLHQNADAKAAAILQALRQIGKAYDFNFDVETTDTIVCSELIYQVYTAIEWPTQKALGRSTISPDHIAVRALNEGPLELVAFYHDGERVSQGPLERMKALMMSGADKVASQAKKVPTTLPSD